MANSPHPGARNPGGVYLIKEVLRQVRLDCEVMAPIDGAEALRFVDGFDADLQTPCPDIFLLDLHLPKQDGAAVLGRLRASERCSQTPVIVMPSADSPAALDSAQRFGAVQDFRKRRDLSQFMKPGTIVKPFFAQ